MAATQTTCSPVDSMGAFYALHQRSEAANSLPPMNGIEIQKFYNLIGVDPPAEEDRRSPPPQHQEVAKSAKKFEYFKAFTDVLERCLKGLKKNVLKTEARGLAPSGHPTSTWARPDVVIYREEYSLENKEGKIYWGSIEMAIEFHSAGKSPRERLEQAATYTLYLLEARPDLVSALGLLVEDNSLVFFFCNAAGINMLSLSNEDDYLPLLCAVLKYLNDGQEKNLDPTLCRVEKSVLFDVFVPGEQSAFRSCRLHYSHDPFGRRPNVFIYEPEKNEVSTMRVIKDQYIRKNRRCKESDILDKIHRNGTHPAVVRMCFYGEITQAICGNRTRVRICLQDYGTDFLSLKTPREVIYALYDLLEVTRSLYFDCNILHRDISPYNIMIRDPEYSQSIQTSSSASPVFIRHLLNPQEPKHKTSIFLIDFGYSQDLESSQTCGKGRTGTPIFIARAVQAGIPLPHFRSMFFPELPQLHESIEAAYVSSYPKRMESFNGPFTPQIGPSKNPPSSPFQHKLEHDGESGVWCFFWWSLLAFPENTVEVPISTSTWSDMLPEYDGGRSGRSGLPRADHRDEILGSFIRRRTSILHPGYKDLFDLFQDIAEAILPDYHWAEGTIRQRPDFVHEILQRIILNFVAENKNATFMDTRKADSNRTVQGFRSIPQISQHQIEARKNSSLGLRASRQATSKKSSTSLQTSSRGSSASRQATSKRSSAPRQATSRRSSASLQASSRGSSASRQTTSKRSSTSRQASSIGSSASKQSRKRKLNEKKILDTTPAVPSVANTDEFSDSQSGPDDDPNDEDTQRFEKKPRTDDASVNSVQEE